MRTNTNQTRTQTAEVPSVESYTMSKADAAKFVGVSLPTFNAMAKRPDFPALVRVGGRHLIIKHRLCEYLDQQAGNIG